MATILRQRDAYPSADTSVRPATFTFSDMASQGDSYVQQVHAEAARIVQEARTDAARIRQEAEAEGRATARDALSNMLDERVGEKLKTLRPALDGIVAEVQTARGEWLAHWRSSAINLAIAMAERVVRRELENDPTISEEWLESSLELAAGSSEITIRLAPTDLDHLRGHAEKLAESVSGIGEARFVADPTISPGGCRVETRHGSIDQQLETQLDRLTEELN